MILQRQRQLLESTTNNVNNSSIEDHTPSFSESRQRFNNNNMTSNSSFSSSMSSFQSPTQVQQHQGVGGGSDASYYMATVRNTEQTQHSQTMTTQRTEKISMSSKTYQVQEK
jgi:hypothetical protein